MYRILLVDDQRDSRQVLRAGLETLGKGIQVTDLPSGEEALLVLARSRVDLLVTDVRLPGISGLELLAKARERNPDLKLILVTGLADPGLRRQVEAAAAAAFFYKPVEMPAFLEAARRCLELDALPPAPPPVEGGGGAAEEDTQPVYLAARAGAGKGQPANTRPASRPAVKPARPPASKPAPLPATPLDRLRAALGAAAVLLVEEAGRTSAQAGELPKGIPFPELVTASLTARWAARAVAPALGGTGQESLLYFPGVQFDLFLAPAGPGRFLAVIRPPVEDGAQLGRVWALLRPWMPGLPAGGDEPPSHSGAVDTTPPAPAAAQEESLPEDDSSDLEALFQPVSGKDRDPGEADRFWDALAEGEDHAGGSSAESLSYEEARRLGLIQGDE